MREQHVGGDAAQVEPLAARQHRHRHLVDLGRREQEFDVRRRLFERFQQRIEGVTRQHMHFVDDVDLVARRHRGIAHRLDNLAHIVDAGVRRGVHFDDVDMAPFGDRAARLAHPARIDRRPALPVGADAIERLGDQARGRRLADPAHPGHQKRMRQPVARDRVAQRAHHRILTDQFGKGLRAIFAREDAVRRRSTPAASPRAGPFPASRVRRRRNRSWHRLRDGARSCRRGKLGGSRNDPRRIRCGCFLPDLTGLAKTTSARLPRRIWRGVSENASCVALNRHPGEGRDDED